MSRDEIWTVPLDRLRVARTNARKDPAAGEEDATLAGLAQSIKEHGLLNPPTVCETADGHYEILAGQRRYWACKELGLPEIPVIVRSRMSEARAVTLSLIENVQRADMHPLDKARAYDELRRHYAGNLREVAATTGVSVRTIERYLVLLKLPRTLQDELGTTHGSAGIGTLAAIAKAFAHPHDMVGAYNQIGGFTQTIQAEILKRAQGDVKALPELVLQAQEGAFAIQRCGTGLGDCPHIPDALRRPLIDAVRALQRGAAEPAASLKVFAGQLKKPRRR